MARKFLYAVAIVIALAIVGMIAFSFFGARLMRAALVPHVAYADPAPLPAGFHAGPGGWISRPDGRGSDPARWQPAGLRAPAPAAGSRAAIFFVHPTSSFDAKRWNASVTDPVANSQVERFVRLQASAFASAGSVWVPRYRQAVYGAFLTDRPDAARALKTAYGDVARAFDAFLAANPDGPIILAAHSQGTRHLLLLLRAHRNDAALHRRIVAVYAPGWPISPRHDLPALGLPACAGPDQTGCVLSWQSFAEPADPAAVTAVFDAQPGLDGASRKGDPMLCVNPLNGGAAPDAAADLNLGMLMGDGGAATTQLLPPGGVGAHCGGRGLLLLDGAPAAGSAVLPGNNYHVYDYSLFWMNIRADALRRVRAWQPTP